MRNAVNPEDLYRWLSQRHPGEVDARFVYHFWTLFSGYSNSEMEKFLRCLTSMESRRAAKEAARVGDPGTVRKLEKEVAELQDTLRLVRKELTARSRRVEALELALEQLLPDSPARQVQAPAPPAEPADWEPGQLGVRQGVLLS